MQSCNVSKFPKWQEWSKCSNLSWIVCQPVWGIHSIILRICQRQELEPRKETHTLEGDTTRGNGKVLHIFFPPNHKEGSEVRCRRPHLGSLSAVQQWFRRASHKKNLQRNGTQDFQILFQRAKRIVPTKKNGLFGGFPGVCTWAGQLPCMLVLHIRVQNYFFRSNFHDRDR